MTDHINRSSDKQKHRDHTVQRKGTRQILTDKYYKNTDMTDQINRSSDK